MVETVVTILAAFGAAFLGAAFGVRSAVDSVKIPDTPVPFVSPHGTERFPIPEKVVLDAYAGSAIVRSTENNDWVEDEKAYPGF